MEETKLIPLDIVKWHIKIRDWFKADINYFLAEAVKNGRTIEDTQYNKLMEEKINLKQKYGEEQLSNYLKMI